MIRYYCKKCGTENDEPVCCRCGKKLPGSVMRDVWQVWRLPLSDGSVWMGVLSVLCLVAVLMLLTLAGMTFALSGAAAVGQLFSSALPSWIAAVIPAGLALALITLALQGREALVYAVDVQGAHVQTWHPASRLRCWARLNSARGEAVITQPDGGEMILSGTRHTLWQDVRRVKYLPARGEIRLYHLPHVYPLTLRLPGEEYPACEALIKKFCKGK